MAGVPEGVNMVKWDLGKVKILQVSEIFPSWDEK